MIQNSVNVLIAVHTVDSIGRDSTSWPVNRIINGSFQPVKYSDIYNIYGITDKTNNVLYCTDTAITADMRIGYNNNMYRIDSIMTYERHTEVYLELVI
jgi:hypothetical protein